MAKGKGTAAGGRDPEATLAAIQNAGIVGMGGGGFPAHAKYRAEVDTVLANGAECEPLLWSDKQLMLQWPEELIEGVANILRPRAHEGGIGFKIEVGPEVPVGVVTDAAKLRQILVNLLGNAVKYSRNDGEVAVTVRAGSADELVVDVRDTGVGIPRDEQDRIFQRGYRATTSDGTRGSGIGLALVQEILKRHGCQIRVDSRPEEGSTFSFSLPLAPDDGPDDGEPRHGGGEGALPG